MTKLYALSRLFAKDESGASLIEYSILIGLITVGVIILIAGVGDWVLSQWTGLDSDITANG